MLNIIYGSALTSVHGYWENHGFDSTDLCRKSDVSVLGMDNTGQGFPDSSVGKESACNAGDTSSIPGLGRSAGEGKGYPLQYLAWRIP